MKRKRFHTRNSVKVLFVSITVLLLSSAIRPAPEGESANGEELYEEHCKSCHRGGGSGFFRMFPPLDDLSWVGDDSTVVKVLLTGLRGPISVDGKQYERQMPPMAYLTDKEVAAVVNYIRTDFNDYRESLKPATVKCWRQKLITQNE